MVSAAVLQRVLFRSDGHLVAGRAAPALRGTRDSLGMRYDSPAGGAT